MFELTTAKELQKPIILVYDSNPESKRFVDLPSFMSQAPPEHSSLLSTCTACVEYTDGNGSSFIRRLVEAAGFSENLD